MGLSLDKLRSLVLRFGLRCPINYIVDGGDWSINKDGEYISKSIQAKHGRIIRVSEEYSSIRNSIIHFGSRYVFVRSDYCGRRNKTIPIVTYFHGADDEVEMNLRIKQASGRARVVHTSCSLTRRHLIKYGCDEGKIIVIPLGVDLGLFKRISEEEKVRRKEWLRIPADRVVIGSFQKDGNGWGRGLEAKLVKGPDVFCDVTAKLATKFPIHVLLSGPARGYVEERLKDARVSYTSLGFVEFQKVAHFMPVCDLYLITSRAEGGPKSVLEAPASGVPLVSTRVGMAADIFDRGGALLCEVDDVCSLARSCAKILESVELRNELIDKGLGVVRSYSWDKIGDRYYGELYQPLLKELGP